MTYEQIRAALLQPLDGFYTAWPNVPIYFENIDEVDLASAPPVFVNLFIKFTTSRQANISPVPFSRQYGRVQAICFVKENTGTVPALRVLQTLTDLYQFQTLGGTHLGAATPGEGVRQAGWNATDWTVPFYADSNM